MPGPTQEYVDPGQVRFLLDDFASGTPGVLHALIFTSDGLLFLATEGLSRDVADALAASISGSLSLATGTMKLVGGTGCFQVTMRSENGVFLCMALGETGGLAVLVAPNADVGVIGHEMGRLAGSVGGRLTPRARNVAGPAGGGS